MRILTRIVRLFFWLIVGLFIGLIVNTLVDSSYELLHKWMPHAFPIYNRIHDPDSYESFLLKKNALSLALTLFISVYLSLRYDNSRDEYIISATDGLFEIPDVKDTYLAAFLVSDVIAAILCGVLIALPVLFIPLQLLEAPGMISALFTGFHTIHTLLGSFNYMLLIPVSVLILHIPALPLAIAYWRAKWLSA